jgi:hypothetical protein
MNETDEGKIIAMAVSGAGSRVFRNNVAQGVVGDVLWIKGGPQKVTVRPGDAVVRHARVLHAGLKKGSGDWIGWTPVLITPEMVGLTVLVFTSLEIKRRTTPTPEQKTWRTVIVEGGGIAGVVHNAVEALDLIRSFPGACRP